MNKTTKTYVKVIVVLIICLVIEIVVLSYLIAMPKKVDCKNDTRVATVVEKIAEEEPEPEPVQESENDNSYAVENPPATEQTNIQETEEIAYPKTSFESDGVWYDDAYRYTWYSSNEAYHYRTPEWTAGSDGIYRDSDGYVVVASSDYAIGTVVSSTPFGAAKVYDTGCASGTLDVYTNF